MDNALAYLDWRGDLPFEVSPFNEVDMFLCSQLSTPDFSKVLGYEDEPEKLQSAAVRFFSVTPAGKAENIGTLQSDELLPMVKRIGETERFKDVRLCHPVNRVINENTEQFAAVTCLFPDGNIIVSFRGTDDTLIGWKEDFNFATHEIVPAQRDALVYLLDVAERHRDAKIGVCGHSKGGNLSIFAASKVPEEVQNRIQSVISFDGPGFKKEFLEGDGYLRIADRVVTILPQNSLVGTLLNRAGTEEYVISSEEWGLAHDGFTWQVLGTGFVKGTGLSENSEFFEQTINGVLNKMSMKKQQAFVDSLFDILIDEGTETVTQLANVGFLRFIEIFSTLSRNKDVKDFAAKVAEYAMKLYGKQLRKG